MTSTDRIRIVHVDNHVLVVNKPAGLLSQGDKTGDTSLVDEARAWLIKTYNKPGNAYVGLVHRLDRPVSGVMVLARTSKGAARLSDQFRRRTILKTYWAVVEGCPKTDEQTLVHTLDEKSCTLDFRTLYTDGRRTLLEVRPHTGRKHQIRRQLAAIGHSIVGDIRYGAKAPLTRHAIALLSKSIDFTHPTTQQEMRFETEPESWWPLKPEETATV